MIAELISIGDELLIGQINNSNATWLAWEVSKAGVATKQITTVSDDKQEILRALSEAWKRADLILVTGGLGPTKDDNTREALCEFFDCGLIENTDVLDDIHFFFSKRGIEVSETNRRQAMVPENCSILRNKIGTAPGLWCEKQNKLLIAMPGVPFELKSMVENQVLPFLEEQNTGNYIIHKTLVTHGLGESFLADKLKDWEKNLPSHIKLAYLPSPGIVRLRLSSSGNDQQGIKKEIYASIKGLKKIIPDNIIGVDDETMQEIVGKLLKNNNLTLSVAESCTGGMISHLITTIPGSSQYFMGGIIAYDNNVKIKQLKVDSSLIAKYGAVSKEAAEAMASGVRNLLQTDYSIVTTGIAGPEGGTAKKPVGLVWVAMAKNDKIISKKFLFGDNRERNILKTSIAALNMIREDIV